MTNWLNLFLWAFTQFLEQLTYHRTILTYWPTNPIGIYQIYILQLHVLTISDDFKGNVTFYVISIFSTRYIGDNKVIQLLVDHQADRMFHLENIDWVLPPPCVRCFLSISWAMVSIQGLKFLYNCVTCTVLFVLWL